MDAGAAGTGTSTKFAELRKYLQRVEVEAPRGIYQRMIAGYREPNRTRSRELMTGLIDFHKVGL